MNLLIKFLLAFFVISLTSAQDTILDEDAIKITNLANFPEILHHFWGDLELAVPPGKYWSFNEAGDLSWTSDLIEWLLKVVLSHIFRGVRDPIDLSPIRIDATYIVSIHADLVDVQISGFSDTITQREPGVEEFTMIIPQLILSGFIPYVDGYVFVEWLPYSGSGDFEWQVNGLSIHVKNGNVTAKMPELVFRMGPTFHTPTLVRFGSIFAFLGFLALNGLVTGVIVFRRFWKRKSGQMKMDTELE